MPLRSLVASARRERRAADSFCKALSSSTLVGDTPFRRCHTSFAATAKFCDSLSTRCTSTPSKSASLLVGSSMVRGSSRARKITRRILGTASATAPLVVTLEYFGSILSSFRIAFVCRSLSRRSSGSVSIPLPSNCSFVRLRSRCSRSASPRKSISCRIEGSFANSRCSLSANSASCTVRLTKMADDRFFSRGYRSRSARSFHWSGWSKPGCCPSCGGG
mmetsp:Transcript_8457/g.20914  ORF Transcript_8457/g.20914 Transcript_8457/m.20914 type:complete len:219 (-) Transcript_8457:254-910(-)